MEQIFETLEASPRGKKCVGMEGVINEAKELLEEDAEEDVLDAGLIAAAQHAEHYEMAGYGTVRAYAVTLGETSHAKLLEQTLNEEKEADLLLTELAETSINIQAAAGESSTSSARFAQRDREVKRRPSSDSGKTVGKTKTTSRSKSRATSQEAR